MRSAAASQMDNNDSPRQQSQCHEEHACILLPLDVHLGMRTSAEHAKKCVLHAVSARLHL
jgi:hypothetical protein